jgi:hypothetical protein
MTDNIANMESRCRDTAVTTLLGGTPSAVPERYREVSATAMLPLRVPQVLIWGSMRAPLGTGACLRARLDLVEDGIMSNAPVVRADS